MDGGICFTQNVDPVHASINEIMDWVHSFGPIFVLLTSDQISLCA